LLVGQLLGENLGRQRAAAQFAAGYCMFAKHTIATPTPASEKMLAFATTTTVYYYIHGSCEHSHGTFTPVHHGSRTANRGGAGQ
jgi:hypothetical protein